MRRAVPRLIPKCCCGCYGSATYTGSPANAAYSKKYACIWRIAGSLPAQIHPIFLEPLCSPGLPSGLNICSVQCRRCRVLRETLQSQVQKCVS
jgi:hypothetical protein